MAPLRKLYIQSFSPSPLSPPIKGGEIILGWILKIFFRECHIIEWYESTGNKNGGG
jgi:hypothetical protein